MWDIRPVLAVSTPDGSGRGVVLRPKIDLILIVYRSPLYLLSLIRYALFLELLFFFGVSNNLN